MTLPFPARAAVTLRTVFFALAQAVFLLTTIGATMAHAADLKLGLAADVSSLDPHYLNIAPNIALSSHLFDALVNVDASGKLIPGLALSWRAVDATTWEFKLRPGVKFHDGSPFTVEDAIFSLDRPATLTKSPGPFTSYTRQIVDKQAVDALTLRLTTATPYGPLPLDVSTIFIVSKKITENASTEDFNSGKAVVGTGPFKFVSFLRGNKVELSRNPDYWGEKAVWDKVTLRVIANNASRTAALLAGDVDAIESVPTPDIARIKRNPDFRLEQRVSWRTIFWTVDQADHSSPDVTDLNGKPLATNPLRDPRVRLAMSKAINRPAVVSRVMEGLAQPASNVVAPGILGYNDAIKVQAYDPAGAKKLLAEAGYPNGFGLTLHGPNNRYINDEQLIQTVAQFFSRIGIRTKVVTLPLAVYFGRAKASEFSVALLGWGTLAGDFGLRSLVGTTNPQTGWGSWNWGNYSNPKVDTLIRSSLASVDPTERNNFARQAAGIALQENAVIPMHHQIATWAMRSGLRYAARVDEFTFAHQFKPQ